MAISGSGARGTMNGPTNNSSMFGGSDQARGVGNAVGGGGGMGSGTGAAGKDLGVTHGATMFGNTVFGTAGGNAQGYATKNKSGGFSDYRNTDGSKSGLTWSGKGGAHNVVRPTSKTATPFKSTKDPQGGYRKSVVTPRIAAAKERRKKGLPSIPPGALMYPFQGANYNNTWNNKNYNKDQSRVPTPNGQLRASWGPQSTNGRRPTKGDGPLGSGAYDRVPTK